MKIYAIALEMDIQSTPGSIFHDVESQAYLNKDDAQRECDELNSHLEYNNGGDPEEYAEWSGYDVCGKPQYIVFELEVI